MRHTRATFRAHKVRLPFHLLVEIVMAVRRICRSRILPARVPTVPRRPQTRPLLKCTFALIVRRIAEPFAASARTPVFWANRSTPVFEDRELFADYLTNYYGRSFDLLTDC
jgi:hypothetical protein